MPNITISLPKDLYERMKRHREIRWSEVVRRAIAEYLDRLEGSKLEFTSREILERLGDDFRRELREIDLEKFERAYDMMRELEWRRLSTIRAS